LSTAHFLEFLHVLRFKKLFNITFNMYKNKANYNYDTLEFENYCKMQICNFLNKATAGTITQYN